MKVLVGVGAFNQEKALVRAFSVIKKTLVSSSSIHGVALLVGLSSPVTGADSAAAPHSCCGRHRAGTGGAARVSGDIVTAILTILTPTIHTERCVQCQNKIDFFHR